MTPFRSIVGAALLGIAGAGMAQTAVPPAPGTAAIPAPGAASEAESAQTAPETAMANARADAEIGSPVAIDEAQYARDLAAYRAAVRARRQTIAQDAAVQDRNERAYAMAMADWRAQAAACRKGKTRACKAPAPNPANY